MSNVQEAMQLIGGKAPSADQVHRVQAIAHSLGIPNNDPMMMQYVALDCYFGVFSELPEKMKLAAETVSKAAAENTAHQVNRGLAIAIQKMGPQIGNALVDHAKALRRVDQTKWIGGVVLLVAVVFTALGWLTHATGYSSGFETGKAQGYKAAADEKAMASWANTDQGRMAYELAQTGNLEMLAGCSGRGWKLSKGVCMPYSFTVNKESWVDGWRVGKSAGGTPTRKINVSWLNYLFGDSA